MSSLPRPAAPQTTPPGLDALAALLSEEMAAVNTEILKNLQSDVPLIVDLARHVVAAGGKRLRPMLTVAAAKLCGYEGEHHIRLAATVEFIHTATLLHDDVIDESEMRRGRESANAVWGNEASVLVGDFLFSRAFQMMVGTGSLEVLRILSDVSAEITKGEVRQLTTQRNLATDEAAYLAVITEKTASLFAAAMEVGAVIANAPDTVRKALRNYGAALGMAFQMMDDVLDYAADQQKLGKTVGDDFREGKVTLPVIQLYRMADPALKALLHRTIEDENIQPGDLEAVLKGLQQHRILSACLEQASRYVAESKENLLSLPPSPLRDALIEAADFVISREL